jgi:hypothetical protein
LGVLECWSHRGETQYANTSILCLRHRFAHSSPRCFLATCNQSGSAIYPTRQLCSSGYPALRSDVHHSAAVWYEGTAR